MSAEEHVRQWLGRLGTGCLFAARLAKAKGGLAMAPFPTPATPTALDAVFDYAAGEHKPVLAVLTAVRTEVALAEQLLALADGERWRVRRVVTPASLTTDDIFVSIEWRTANPDVWSSPMGLGPFGTMPPTRRAPYTVVAAWTGGHENTFRRKVEPVVHFLDVSLSNHRLTQDKYADMTKESRKATTEMLLDDSAGNYRNVAFRLSASVGAMLEALPVAA
ncbi:MAG: hypothetical protein KF773_29150 [Deltaproteobacteria bacterium]|nr:hypothetical protein [Deltaproteobacteria bacterium]